MIFAEISLLTTNLLCCILCNMKISRIIYLASLWIMGIALGTIVVSDIMYPVSDAFLKVLGSIALIAAAGILFGIVSDRRRK